MKEVFLKAWLYLIKLAIDLRDEKVDVFLN
jgi:hypothetical protein